MEDIIYAYNNGHIVQYLCKDGRALRIRGCAVRDKYKADRIEEMFKEIFKKR